MSAEARAADAAELQRSCSGAGWMAGSSERAALQLTSEEEAQLAARRAVLPARGKAQYWLGAAEACARGVAAAAVASSPPGW